MKDKIFNFLLAFDPILIKHHYEYQYKKHGKELQNYPESFWYQGEHWHESNGPTDLSELTFDRYQEKVATFPKRHLDYICANMKELIELCRDSRMGIWYFLRHTYHPTIYRRYMKCCNSGELVSFFYFLLYPESDIVQYLARIIFRNTNTVKVCRRILRNIFISNLRASLEASEDIYDHLVGLFKSPSSFRFIDYQYFCLHYDTPLLRKDVENLVNAQLAAYSRLYRVSYLPVRDSLTDPRKTNFFTDEEIRKLDEKYLSGKPVEKYEFGTFTDAVNYRVFLKAVDHCGNRLMNLILSGHIDLINQLYFLYRTDPYPISNEFYTVNTADEMLNLIISSILTNEEIDILQRLVMVTKFLLNLDQSEFLKVAESAQGNSYLYNNLKTCIIATFLTKKCCSRRQYQTSYDLLDLYNVYNSISEPNPIDLIFYPIPEGFEHYEEPSSEDSEPSSEDSEPSSEDSIDLLDINVNLDLENEIIENQDRETNIELNRSDEFDSVVDEEVSVETLNSIDEIVDEVAENVIGEVIDVVVRPIEVTIPDATYESEVAVEVEAEVEVVPDSEVAAESEIEIVEPTKADDEFTDSDEEYSSDFDEENIPEGGFPSERDQAKECTIC